MNRERDLSGRVVLITGPARGIGEATARLLAARGARLALVGLEPERLAALAASLGSGHSWAECDVTDQAQLERAVAATIAAHGGIDAVIANAGIASNGLVAVTPADALARTIEVNLIGVVRTVRATLEAVTARRGYYLLISSAASLVPAPGIAAYGAAKAGVEMFGDALRLELRHKGVRVGTAHPSWIDTDLVRDLQHDLVSFNEMVAAFPGPFGKITPVEECAEALVDGIVRRKRKVFVPKSLAPLALFRQLLGGPFADWVISLHARRALPVAEAEIVSLGRSFGEHSVETQRERRAAGAAGPETTPTDAGRD
jgi:NAD(P)-dependent dehydrogenase (short-subunit alcohol dehydrogenase family)